MDKKKLGEYGKLLLKIKMEVLNGGILKSNEDLTVSTDDLPDEADLANNVINQQVTFNMRHREMSKIRRIEDALLRIENGHYGHCEECEEPISEKRLQNQPWANLCITHAEEHEREQGKQFA